MKTYNKYQEAKIENPKCEIVTTAKGWDGFKEIAGKFEPLVCGVGLCAHWLDDECGWIKCNPADYCMTVEEFFNSGHKLTGGDVVIGADSEVYVIQDCESWNFSGRCDDNKRFILRAEALDRSNCTPSIHADSEFYKKPRTRVEYEQIGFHKCHEAMFKHEMDGGLYIHDGAGFVIASMYEIVDNWISGLYRKIETEIDERQEFIDAMINVFTVSLPTKNTFGEVFDSGKFKYIGGDDADK